MVVMVGIIHIREPLNLSKRTINNISSKELVFISWTSYCGVCHLEPVEVACDGNCGQW